MIAFVISCFITVLIFHKNKASEITTRALCGTYVNAAIYTIPVMTFVLEDPKAALLGNLLQVVCIQPVFITLFCIIQNKRRAILMNIITAPIVFMPCFGLGLNYFDIDFSTEMLKAVEMTAMSSTALSLVVFGMTLSDLKTFNFNKDVALVSIVKNIIHPLIGFVVGKYLFSLENYWLKALILSTAAPTAFVAYLLTKNFTEEGKFARDLVAITSVVSVLSLIIIHLAEF